MRTAVGSPDPDPEPRPATLFADTSVTCTAGNVVCDWQPRPHDPVRAAQIRAYAIAWYTATRDAGYPEGRSGQ